MVPRFIFVIRRTRFFLAAVLVFAVSPIERIPLGRDMKRPTRSFTTAVNSCYPSLSCEQATRYAVGEECDLAILTVEDESFWEETSPLHFGELPELTDQVSVIGYEIRKDAPTREGLHINVLRTVY